MKCPNDETTLLMTDRQGIEIDYCPQCRGVWLDRGELDKLIERAAEAEPTQRAKRPAQEPRDQREPEYQTPPRSYEQPHKGYHGKPYKKKKRFDFLDDIFDFG